MINEITYKPIGIIHSPFKEPKGTPIQPEGARGVAGTVELFPEYAGGLKDIEGFSHLILVYHFHLAGDWKPEVKPYMDENPHGVFATRAPARPVPVGVSVVRLTAVEKGVLHIRDVDIVDGTPLLDIKPYVPEFDIREVEKTGWLKQNVHKLASSRDDERFVK